MRMRHLVKALSSVALVLGVLSPAAAMPALTAGPGPGHFSSDNVEWISVNPRHSGSSGGRLHEGYFYVTDPRGVSIYDVKDPANPVLTGSVTVFQSGTMAALGQEDPDTNGEILIVDAIDPGASGTPSAKLLVIDVKDKTAPRVIGSLSGQTDHTWTCFADCTYAIGRTGSVIDLRNPAAPTLATNWKSHVAGSGYTHDFTEVRPGRLMSVGQPSFYIDSQDFVDGLEGPRLRMLSRLNTSFPSLGYHSAAWPRGGQDRFLLMGTEIAPPGTNNLAGSDCDGPGELATYDTTEVLAAEAAYEEDPSMGWGPAGFTKLHNWRLSGRGVYADGKAPFHTLYCEHWFDTHPDWEDGGLVVMGHYDYGTRFLSVDGEGKITEIGWFQPVAGYTASAYWVSKDIVYVLDYRRGLDILRLNQG